MPVKDHSGSPRRTRDLVVKNALQLAPGAPNTVHEGGQIDFLSSKKADGTPWNAQHSVDQYQESFRVLHPNGQVTETDRRGVFRPPVMRCFEMTTSQVVFGGIFATTATTYVSSPDGPNIQFIVPPSLKVLVILSAGIYADGDNYNLMSYELYDINASGVYFAGGDADALITSKASEFQMSRASIATFQPQHEASPFQIRPRYRVNSGTGTFQRRSIIVAPSL